MMQFAEFVLEFSLKQGQDFIFKKSRIQGISNIPETLKRNLTHEQGRKIGNIQGGARSANFVGSRGPDPPESSEISDFGGGAGLPRGGGAQDHFGMPEGGRAPPPLFRASAHDHIH